MRVLFMITRDWLNPAASGGDIAPSENARYLALKGHSVTMLVSSFPGASWEETVDGVRIVRLGPVLSLSLVTFIHYVRHCRGRYDVIVEEGFGGSRIPRFAPLYVKEPIITEWHQVHHALFASQYPRILTPALDLLERLTAYLHRNALVRAGTSEWQEAFVGLGFKRENVFVLPVSIRESWLSKDVSEPAAGRVSEPRVVWLGKFRRYKCPDHVVMAMKKVVTQMPQARLILVGRHDDRRYERKLQRLVTELGLEENVEFRFNVSEEEKKSILRGSRALVLPSPVEGFGIVVLEANACGIPVVASTGVPEGAVQHEYNGLRYPFGDIDALSWSIIRLLKDDELHLRLSANGLEFSEQFAWSRIGMQFEEIVKGTMAVGSVQA